CRTLDSVFWESKYNTLELHDSGYSATAEKYGLVDNIDDEKVQYRFTPETDYQPNLIPLTESAWEEGGWYTTNGEENATPGRIRTKAQNTIEVIEGGTYTFHDNSLYASAIENIYILHYRDGQYIGSSSGWEQVERLGRLTFNARGDRKSTRLNSSHVSISYAVFCLKKKKRKPRAARQLAGVIRASLA